MEIVLIKSCFLYCIHAPHQRFTATSRCSTPIVLQDLDAQHLLQEQHHAQLRPKCQNRVGVILLELLETKRKQLQKPRIFIRLLFKPILTVNFTYTSKQPQETHHNVINHQ